MTPTILILSTYNLYYNKCNITHNTPQTYTVFFKNSMTNNIAHYMSRYIQRCMERCMSRIMTNMFKKHYVMPYSIKTHSLCNKIQQPFKYIPFHIPFHTQSPKLYKSHYNTTLFS